MSPSDKKSWRKDAEQIFKALDGFDQLNKPSETSTALKVGFQELFSYATRSSFQPSERLQQALLKDQRLRSDLNALVRKQAIVSIPRAVAASSGDIETRSGDGFTLTLKTSQADQNHVYLIITATDRDETPTLLFATEENGTIHRLVIEDYYDGEAQILLSDQDQLVKALRNHATEVILR